MEFLDIDGSYGEGGGQILRTALSFSVITGKPVRISKVRAGRTTPGLRRQHVSSLRILGEVFHSNMDGVTEGSSQVSFVPGPPAADSISLDMKTAASITLVLQAVVPAASLVQSRLSLDLTGGTDVPWSPSFDYLDVVMKAAYKAIGIEFSAEATRRGYYPRGGGKVSVDVEPCGTLGPLQLSRPPAIKSVDVTSRCGTLPRHVAERQLLSALSVLYKNGIRVGRQVVAEDTSDSPGSSILISSTGESHFLGSDQLGAKGRPSEEVGRTAAERFMTYVESGACVDDNLADMLVPLLLLAPAPSAVRISRISNHLETSLYIARLFSDGDYAFRREGQGAIVLVKPA